MTFEALVSEFQELVRYNSPLVEWGEPWLSSSTNGMEVYPGWFHLYSEYSQTRTVLLHAETGMVFKNTYSNYLNPDDSGRYLGDAEFSDRVWPVRLPIFEVVGDVLISEYVNGEQDECGEWYGDPAGSGWREGWCEHAYAMRDMVVNSDFEGDPDTHTGNWLYLANEIVYLDFD